MHSIKYYEDSKESIFSKKLNSIYSWITILILVLILFCILSFIPFNIYKNYVGYVRLEDNDTYLALLLNNGDFPFNKYNKLYISRDKYNYTVSSIEENIVTIKLNLKDNIKIDNNKVFVSILENRTSLINILSNKIRKGFGV